jgi:hypothetical protein
MSWLSQGLHLVAQTPAPVASGIISGLSTLVAAGVVTWRLNRGVKRAEFVVGFTQRYHDILGDKFKVNLRYDRRRAGNNAQVPSETLNIEKKEAQELYRRLFGLMFDEFFAYQRHLLDQEVFAEWMKWRMDDYNGGANYEFKICDMTYREGWNRCKDIGPSKEHLFKEFMNNVHLCQNYKRVEREVRLYKPTPFWRAVRRAYGK